MPVYPVKKNGKPTGRFDAVVYKNGRRFEKRFRNKAQAWEFIAAISRGDTPEKKSARVLLESFFLDYLAWCKTDKSAETFRVDSCRLKIFRTWCAENKITHLDAITPPAIETFKAYYFKRAPFGENFSKGKKSHNPANTFNRYLQLIKAMMNWAVRQGYLKENPIGSVPQLKDIQKKFPRVFSQEELKVIFGNSPPPLDGYFKFLAYTGMRNGELYHLEWADIDLKTGVVKIQSKSGFHPKTYEIRAIPIHPELKAVIKTLPKQGRYVFGDGRDGHYATESWILRVLKAVLFAGKMADGNLYTFRHTFATRLLQSGADLATVKDLMGHSTIQTTMRYVHSSDKSKDAAIRKLTF